MTVTSKFGSMTHVKARAVMPFTTQGVKRRYVYFCREKTMKKYHSLVGYINRFRSFWHLEYRFLKFVFRSCDWPEPGESWWPWQISRVNRIVFLIIYTFQYTIFIKWFVNKVWCDFVVFIQYKISVFRLILLSGFVNFVS